MALTDKKKLFADHYLVLLNATEAAVKAGYSEKTAYSQGSRLLKDVEVHAYIEEKQQVRAEKLSVDADWVLKRLMEISDRCMTAEPVIEFNPDTRQMEESGEYKFDSTGANRATELIGKHLGMFKDSPNVNVNVGVTITDDIK
ncbi:phage terminase small subunit [Paenibacillus prosopidis]|uniref:Phage terminase small subunit n=2 Tax=Paenibacillus prosopidis TaxID=630520 RepID=A0A368VQR5_9BACL|nr:phage terminase small subunit [Paenibacillus prosopidis]